MTFDCKLILKKGVREAHHNVSKYTPNCIEEPLQIAPKMQSKLYQKCTQNGAEIVCKNSVQIVLQKLHFLYQKKVL